MALPDRLADLERKVSARLNEAIAEVRHEMRRAVEAGAQQANAAMLSELDKVGQRSAEGLLAEHDLDEATGELRAEGRRDLARTLRLALVEFDRARTQSAVLEALLARARPLGDRAALWLMRPQEIVGWASLGFAGEPVAGVTILHTASPALERLAEGRGCVRLAPAEADQMARALAVDAAEEALFIPLVLRDRVAAALYLDAAAGRLEVEALQLLTLAAAQRLELQALATRSFTPTLFLGDEAPESERGLALWDPESSPAAEPQPEGEGFAASAAAAVVSPDDSIASSAALAPIATTGHEHEALFEATPPTQWTASTPSTPERFAAPAPPTHPEEPPSAEISWQMEETGETAFMGSRPHHDLMAELEPMPAAPELPVPPPVLGTPTHEIALPVTPPAPDFDVPEWREVDESTAPHSTLAMAPPAPSDIATQRFTPPPAVTHEIPQPPAASSASTIAFVPPALDADADFSDDATVRIQRSSLVPPPPALPPPTPPRAPAPEPEAPEEQTHPAIGGPGVPEDEPTINRGARTTEVVAPPDLQGPGWAFSSTRTARASGDNALHEEARRLARLLVSEIKLYNEDQVEEGRHNRDIYHRLKDDIDRSRQIYEERVHESVRGTTDYFQQELIRSLAGGDPRALGI